MFNQIKDLYKLKQQAGELQSMLAGETVEAENKGVKITMNGNQEVLNVIINPELSKEDQEKYLKETFNDAIKKVQQLMAQKMMSGQIKGFGM
ncbi:MAG TPA: YbaB/EbfC family nucleoid-associated protein [Patescibacteria group bacterium]|nr:YbaB/EbfC family nucleoid-associated protein [Patescibacteria group bacterium]